MSLTQVFRRAARLQQGHPEWTACVCIAKACQGRPGPEVTWAAAHVFFCDYFRPSGLSPTAPFWALPPRRHAERIFALWTVYEIAKENGL